jgi:hypothetical protein
MVASWRHQPRRDDAVERRLHLRVAEVDRGLLGVDLRLPELGLRGIAVGERVVERLLRRDLAAGEIGLPLVFRFGLLQRGLGRGFGRLRLLELELVGLGLDHEQRSALLHLIAVLVVDLLQETRNPRDQVGGVDRRGIAGRLEIARDRLLQRDHDGDLRRRRRHVAVILPAAGQHQRERAQSGKRNRCGRSRRHRDLQGTRF